MFCKEVSDIDNNELIEVKILCESLKAELEEIKEITKEHRDYDIDIALLKEKLKVINEEVSELQNVVRSIEEKPVENFDKIKMYVVTTVISAIIGFIINKLLEK